MNFWSRGSSLKGTIPFRSKTSPCSKRKVCGPPIGVGKRGQGIKRGVDDAFKVVYSIVWMAQLVQPLETLFALCPFLQDAQNMMDGFYDGNTQLQNPFEKAMHQFLLLFIGWRVHEATPWSLTSISIFPLPSESFETSMEPFLRSKYIPQP